MTSPRSLESLREMRSLPRGSSGKRSASEETLDALLSTADKRAKPSGVADVSGPEQPPLERLRDMFAEKLIPSVRSIEQRYADKGIGVHMDASDFLGGGRVLYIEIEFKD